MLNSQRLVWALTLIAAAVLLTACGGSDTPPPGATVFAVDTTSIFDGNDQLTTTLTDTLTLGETVTAELADPNAAHNWLFQGATGQNVTITVQSPNDQADPAAVLIDPQGTIMMQEDGNFGPSNQDVQITLTLALDGIYTIRVTTSTGGEYEISVQ